jgi:hypothetical protein
MSETVHYKGKLEMLYSETLPLEIQLQSELAKVGIDYTVCDYLGNYEEALEQLQEVDEYYLYKNRLYLVTKKLLDHYDVSSAHRLDESTISFEVMYYNGGCDFYEALDSALEGL